MCLSGAEQCTRSNIKLSGTEPFGPSAATIYGRQGLGGFRALLRDAASQCYRHTVDLALCVASDFHLSELVLGPVLLSNRFRLCVGLSAQILSRHWSLGLLTFLNFFRHCVRLITFSRAHHPHDHDAQDLDWKSLAFAV